MSNFVDNVKTLLKRTIAYVFQPKEKKMANEVERIREKYEKYDKVRLNNFLIGYKSQVKQLQLVLVLCSLELYLAILGSRLFTGLIYC